MIGTKLAHYEVITEALEAAHEKSVVHRDLKPANIKLTESGKVKVMLRRPASENAVGSLHATFLLNFFDEVRRRLPVGK